MKLRARKHLFEFLLITPAFIYLLGFLIVVVVTLSIMSLTAMDRNYAEIFPTLENWRIIFSTTEFMEALRNTIGFVIIGTPLELLAGLVLALLIYRNFFGRNLVQSIFMLPLAIPALVTAIILFIIFDYPGGHVNNILTGKHIFFPALLKAPVNFRSSAVLSLGISLLGKVWRDMPISMLILLSGLNSIEPQQYEAAVTMGASAWQRFKWITVPLLIPAISSVLVLRSIEMWKEFIFPFVLAGRYPLLGTLIEGLYHGWQKPERAAVVALVLLVCVILSTLVLFGFLRLVRRNIVRFV